MNLYSIESLFNKLDWYIFFLLMLITIISIIWGNKREKAKEKSNAIEHLLMGRRLTLPLFVATLVSTWYGGIFGVASIAFDSGIFNFITQGVFWYATYLIFAFYLIKKIRKTNALTLPDLIGKTFGPRSKQLSAVFNILNLIPIVYAISLGTLISMIFGTGMNVSILLGVFFVTSYSIFGGFKSVVYSDLIQFLVMIISVVFLFVFCAYNFGSKPLMTLPDRYFSILGGHGLFETIAWGLIALSTLVDPNFYQRIFAAKTDAIAKKGIIISTIIWICFDLSLTFGAMYAKALLPLADSSNGYFEFAFRVLPQGLRGFFLAGIVATILSTMDSYLFLASTTVSHDMIKIKNKRYTKPYYYLSFIFIACLSILLANAFDGNIKAIWKTLGSLSAAALLIPVCYSYLWKNKLTDNQFVFTALSAGLLTFVWRLTPMKEQTGMDELYPACFLNILLVLYFHKTNKDANLQI